MHTPSHSRSVGGAEAGGTGLVLNPHSRSKKSVCPQVPRRPPRGQSGHVQVMDSRLWHQADLSVKSNCANTHPHRRGVIVGKLSPFLASGPPALQTWATTHLRNTRGMGVLKDQRLAHSWRSQDPLLSLLNSSAFLCHLLQPLPSTPNK